MDVMPIAEARAGLSRLLADFRANDDVEVVVVGAHRRPDAALVPYRRYRELTVAQKGKAVGLARLRELKPVIDRLASAAHLSDVRVFGSVARGEETLGSDVDLLVDAGDESTLFDIAQFELDLELILGVPVTAVAANGLDTDRDRDILDGALPL
ncbi:putative nucleotidyltransferase [Microbacterium sp. W4I4]|uniref:nucleotidyltransferase domain-containing protein n=1 Tax=Microbacterium sp. W4I4 TaxID=3042295 RepID=UPI002785BC80|nr:nucleotidyltransferase domain-containing protein [Microbacterium sp. W4I4]MDQ0614406.1 putative nucleotidyltransferase [Microbacterium sp. W4I4]